ncbi:MAG: sensor histidine kinase [Firmicutes bacterium]|nr:sensor histidine kinase [Bacillota bacterium]
MDKGKRRRPVLRRRRKTLDLRAAVLFVCLGALAVCAALSLIPAFAVLIGIFLLCAAAWFWIVRPYLKTEELLRLFLEGYGLSEVERSGLRMVSGATQLLFAQLQEVLSPTQLFDMNKRQAQYLALQNQINPHFLYNTLESIRSEALLAGLGDLADMTESLATFFRYTITKVENLVSVEEELQNCETYFSIQQYRFGDRLELDVRCAPEDRADIYRCRIPKLTMQPILENSIIHGTELKVGTGHLVISLARTAKRLLIRISDDGLGMDEETLRRINGRLGKGKLNIATRERESEGGLALVNVDNRIRLLFGDEYGLHVFSVLGAGTDVEISLPAISSDRDVKNSEVLG